MSQRQREPPHHFAPARQMPVTFARGRLPGTPRLGAWNDILTYTLVGVCFAAIAYLSLHILMFRYGRDQGIYATVADTILRGGMPYRDAWDFKPPGIYVIYAATRALFGSAQAAIRGVEVVGLFSMVGAFVILARRFFGVARIGIFAGALAMLVHAELEFWHTAQPESFAGMLTAWALVLATFETSDALSGRLRQLGAWAAAGALYGAAFLLKPPLGGAAVVSAVFAARRIHQQTDFLSQDRRWRTILRVAEPVVFMGAGAVVVVVLCLAWFGLRGALGDLYEVLFVFTPQYTRLGWEDATLPGMVYLAFEEWLLFFSSGHAVGILAAFIGGPLAPREREGLTHLVLVIAVQLVGVGLQGKFFPYHYGASLLIGSLIAGVGVEKLWQRALAAGWIGVGSFAVILPIVLFARSATRDTDSDFLDRCRARQRFLLGQSAVSRGELDGKLYSVADVSYAADRQVADWLREHLTESELVYIWGFEPMIYDLSGRRAASRFLYNVPQRVAWFRDRARAVLMVDLAARPPRAVVVEHRDVFPTVTGDTIDSADSLPSFPAFSGWLAEKYQPAATIEDFDIYLSR